MFFIPLESVGGDVWLSRVGSNDCPVKQPAARTTEASLAVASKNQAR